MGCVTPPEGIPALPEELRDWSGVETPSCEELLCLLPPNSVPTGALRPGPERSCVSEAVFALTDALSACPEKAWAGCSETGLALVGPRFACSCCLCVGVSEPDLDLTSADGLSVCVVLVTAASGACAAAAQVVSAPVICTAASAA